MLLFILLLLILSEGSFLHNRARWMLNISQAPVFVAVVDGIQLQTLSFTDTNTNKIYIDMERFECCPNSYINVLNHEIGHSRGMMHNDALGSVMNYSVTINEHGNVIDDTYLYPFNDYARYQNAPTHQ